MNTASANVLAPKAYSVFSQVRVNRSLVLMAARYEACGLAMWVWVALLFASQAAQAAAGACAVPNAQSLQGVVNLPGNCVFTEPLKIVKSGTRLNCNGSVFDGKGQVDEGLLIEGGSDSLRDIEIRNCTFRNQKSAGIRIAFSGEKGTHEESFERAPQNITIDSVTIENSLGSGLYINAYVTKVTLKNSVISGSRGPGIYLSHSTRDNRLTGNRFLKNGFDTAGKRKREAIAIDSSAHNFISGNLFSGNGQGGIFLYKNCGERAASGFSPIRWQHSDQNEITGNQFVGEQVGVWIASRQSRDLSQWDCRDKPMDNSKTFYEDFANQNVVKDNSFCGVSVAVRIEGDENRVLGNRYDDATKAMVQIPTTKRGEILGRPPVQNVTESNNRGACPLPPVR